MNTQEKLARTRQMIGEDRSISEIAKELDVSEYEAENMVKFIKVKGPQKSQKEIEWGYNCLTQGVHHGRPEKIWNLPLGYAVLIYGQDALKEIVVARIYNDAMQYVDNSPFVQKGTGATMEITSEWANRIKEIAEDKFLDTLKRTDRGLADYYTSSQWRTDIQGIDDLVKQDKLNPHYEPLHSHDSINLLCRIIGVSASIQASKEVG